MTEKPIIVDTNPLPAALFSAVRSAVALLLAFALGRGWVKQDVVELVTALVALGLPTWGAYIIHRKGKEQAAVAADPRVPDSVTQTK